MTSRTPFPPRAWADQAHHSNKLRPNIRCVGCGRKGCVTYWGPWCFDCNVERMDRLSGQFEQVTKALADSESSEEKP